MGGNPAKRADHVLSEEGPEGFSKEIKGFFLGYLQSNKKNIPLGTNVQGYVSIFFRSYSNFLADLKYLRTIRYP